MRLGALVSVLFATGVFGQLKPEDDPTVQRYIADLQKRFVFDWERPPTSRLHYGEERSCFIWWFTCNPTYFNANKKLVPKYLPDPYKPEWVKSTPNVSVYMERVQEPGTATRSGETDVVITSAESITKIDSTTNGWHIGAQLSGDAGGGSIGISGGYSEQWTTGTYKTREITRQTTCPARHDCSVETWTFHVHITGHCETQPIINCAGDRDICQDQYSGTCSQYTHFREKNCVLHKDALSRYRFDPCEVRTPIVDRVGQPMTRRAFLQQSLHPDDKSLHPDDKENPEHEDSKDDNEQGCAEIAYQGEDKAPEALGKDGIGCKLDNGQWYNQATNSYFNEDTGEFECKKNVNKPETARCPPCADEEYTGTDKPIEATGKDEYGCTLPNNEWYDPSDNSYLNATSNLWECRRNVPKPLLTNCPSSRAEQKDTAIKKRAATREEPKVKITFLDEEPDELLGKRAAPEESEIKITFLDEEPGK